MRSIDITAAIMMHALVRSQQYVIRDIRPLAITATILAKELDAVVDLNLEQLHQKMEEIREEARK